VKQLAVHSIDTATGRCTCAVCPLLCDDILITARGVEGGCDHGREAILATLADADSPHPEPGANGHSVSRVQAVDQAAALLTAARRVLVTGLAGATLEAITAACDLAETLGAAVDAGLPESARAAGPTIARAGEVTAVWEELRDRADLVIFWGCDPADSHPRFSERFVAPALSDGRSRRTIAVGPASVMPAAAGHRHLPLAHDLAVEAARCLQMRIVGRAFPAGLDASLAAVCDALHEAIRSATCVAVVTNDHLDPVGLEAWSIVHLIRTIAHAKPAFQIPLAAGIAGGGANVAGVAAVCTWRYGAAGGIARADRIGSLFLQAESDARRLIDRGEVDAVLVLGRLSGTLERAIAARGDALTLVRISDAAEIGPPPAARTVRLRSASVTIATTGTMLREDGRRVVLIPPRRGEWPEMRELLVDLANAVRQSLAVSAVGGRP
jgi:formylmethanofuran dehydrogenase subunit B